MNKNNNQNAQSADGGSRQVEQIVSLDDDIKTKLAEVIEIWADRNLVGKPAILANAMYFNIEKEMIKNINEINSKFKG